MRKTFPTTDFALVNAWAEQEGAKASMDGSYVAVEGSDESVSEVEARWIKYRNAREALRRYGI